MTNSNSDSNTYRPGPRVRSREADDDSQTIVLYAPPGPRVDKRHIEELDTTVADAILEYSAAAVILETQVSKDGGRKHYDWPSFKHDYFEELIAQDEGIRLAPPTQGRRDSADWKERIDSLIIERAERVEHVGPRTEAVKQLHDYLKRTVGYRSMDDMNEYQGVYGGGDGGEDGVRADRGATELRVPTSDVKRICDTVGISPRALQVELEARGAAPTAGGKVSDATYAPDVDGDAGGDGHE